MKGLQWQKSLEISSGWRREERGEEGDKLEFELGTAGDERGRK